MTASPPSMNLEYAQARVQARHGQRPGPSDWSRLLTSRDLPHFLESARPSPVGRWVSHVDGHSDAHGIERAMARELREHIDEVAGWVPERWRPAVTFTRWLPLLPAVARLLDEEPPPHWMADDPFLGPLVHADRSDRLEAMRATELAPIIDAVVEQERTVLEAWRAHWDDLLPILPPAGARELHAFADEVQSHLDAMAEAAPTADGWELRGALESRVSPRVRTRSGRPVAIFAHLLLVALDLERLRGAMVRRALLPSVPETTSWV